MRNSQLATTLARDIEGLIRSGDLRAETHMSAQVLADRFGVSRSPVRHALQQLADRGLLEQRQHRGYFVRSLIGDMPSGGGGQLAEPMSHYQQFAEDWVADHIPSEVTEQMLRDR